MTFSNILLPSGTCYTYSILAEGNLEFFISNMIIVRSLLCLYSYIYSYISFKNKKTWPSPSWTPKVRR